MEMMEMNKNYNENCLYTMAKMKDNFIDLTVTSPPYDGLRTYNGYSFPFENIAKELYRVTKKGGAVVWIVGDATIKGSESGTSFKQALYFKECGFNLHDTMIWHKPNAMPQVDKTRFTQSFEYMFVFTKGKPKTTKPLKTPTKNGGKFLSRGDGNSENINKAGGNKVAKERIAFNVYNLSVGGKNYGHPAIFPEQLANDHIISWSNEGDLVYDPFMGSGTTAKMAKINNRNWIGSEMSSEYCDIVHERIANVPCLLKL
jgi:site-specific DNA-methyltransferase (adenine-specific)|tara:strand:+ start:27 stop:800 length:774 start_codon:yes stop_codon:yes gene_type:complete